MRKIFTVILFSFLFWGFTAVAADGRKSAVVTGNSSGGGGVSVYSPVVMSVVMPPPPQRKACLDWDSKGKSFVRIRWGMIWLERVTGYDIYSCTDDTFSTMNAGFSKYRNDVIAWQNAVRAWKKAGNQSVPVPQRPELPADLKQYLLGTVPSQALIVPPENPENKYYEFVTPLPRAVNGAFCIIDEDSYQFVDELSKPMAAEACVPPSTARSALPPPSDIKACASRNSDGYFGEGTYFDELTFYFDSVKDPNVTGYKLYTCDDSDFANGEPALSTLQKNWVLTQRNQPTDTGHGEVMNAPASPYKGGTSHPVLEKKYCIAAYDNNGEVGYVSKPVIPGACN